MYTKEDYEQYLEYAKALWDMVISVFADKLSVESDRTDPMDALKDGLKIVTGSTVPQMVYQNSLLTMYHWMMEDCPFTGHKGKASQSTTSGIQEAIDEAVATGKDVVLAPPHNTEHKHPSLDDTSICKHCGAPIVFTKSWGRQEWYHSFQDDLGHIHPDNRYCPEALFPDHDKIADPSDTKAKSGTEEGF